MGEWILVIVFALAGGGYNVTDDPVDSREMCAEYARLAYTSLDTKERIVVAVGCFKRNWAKS